MFASTQSHQKKVLNVFCEFLRPHVVGQSVMCHLIFVLAGLIIAQIKVWRTIHD